MFEMYYLLSVNLSLAIIITSLNVGGVPAVKVRPLIKLYRTTVKLIGVPVGEVSS